jgi:hypothetical protein
MNTGNVIIEQDDIEVPIEIKISNAHVVQARVRDDSFGAKPGNPIVGRDNITLEPFFLNPKGYLDYDLVTDGNPSISLGKGVIRLLTDPIGIEFNQEETQVFVTVVRCQRVLKY